MHAPLLHYHRTHNVFKPPPRSSRMVWIIRIIITVSESQSVTVLRLFPFSLSCAHSSSLGTRVRGSSSLVSSPHISSPSDLPGSCPTSQLASPALDSSLVGTPSWPASPADEPSFYFPTPPVDRTFRVACPQPVQPTRLLRSFSRHQQLTHICLNSRLNRLDYSSHWTSRFAHYSAHHCRLARTTRCTANPGHYQLSAARRHHCFHCASHPALQPPPRRNHAAR